MNTFTGIPFTRIPVCTSCKFKWIFMAMFFGFEHQEYRSVYCANLSGFHGNFNGFWASRISECTLCQFKWVLSINHYGLDKFYGHIYENIRAYIMQIQMGCQGNFNRFWASRISDCSVNFIWVFMAILWTHLLEYQSVNHANFNGFSWQFFIGFEHQEYWSVYYANLNGFSWKFL